MKEKSVAQRNIVVEYLRFAFTVVVAVSHMRSFSLVDNNQIGILYLWGKLAVDFFGVLSGFLMAKSLDRPVEDSDFTHCAIEFMQKKWHLIFVMNALSYIVAFTSRQFVLGGGFSTILSRFMNNISEPLLLTTTGIKKVRFNYNGASWYLSALFLCSVVLVPLVMKLGNFFRYLSFPCGIVLLGMLMQWEGSVLSETEADWRGALCLGNLRIMADLLIGFTAYYIYIYHSGIGENLKKNHILCRCLRIFVLLGYGLIFIECFTKFKSEWGPFYILLLGVLCTLTFLLFNGFGANNRFFFDVGKCLGDFSLALCLNHRYWVFFLNGLKLNISLKKTILIYAALSIASSLLVDKAARAFVARHSLTGNSQYFKER